MSTEDPVLVRNNPARSRFEAQVGELLAKAEYRLMDKTITFTHTVVPDALKGHGIGASLAKAALEHARREGYRVVPECVFIAGYIKRHPEYSDLLSA